MINVPAPALAAALVHIKRIRRITATSSAPASVATVSADAHGTVVLTHANPDSVLTLDLPTATATGREQFAVDVHALHDAVRQVRTSLTMTVDADAVTISGEGSTTVVPRVVEAVPIPSIEPTANPVDLGADGLTELAATAVTASKNPALPMYTLVAIWQRPEHVEAASTDTFMGWWGGDVPAPSVLVCRYQHSRDRTQRHVQT